MYEDLDIDINWTKACVYNSAKSVVLGEVDGCIFVQIYLYLMWKDGSDPSLICIPVSDNHSTLDSQPAPIMLAHQVQVQVDILLTAVD